MLRLPYIPNPYPDEILGSWLARVALLNGGGAWRALLEATGYGPRIESPHFDMVTYTAKCEALLSALGIAYEQAMIEMTTLPYWLTFDAVDDPGARLPGMPSTPGFLGKMGRTITSIGAAGMGHSSGGSRVFRYCPKCLVDDVSSCGQAYWHRAHHLPNTIACHLHDCVLRSACPSCGLAIATAAKQLAALPSLRCACGQDLCVEFDEDTPRSAYLALAKLSAEALNLEQPCWNRDQVRSYLRSVLKRETGQLLRQYQSAIETTFGEWRPLKQMRSLAASGRHFQHPEFNLRFDFSSAAAPESCALMVALGLRFADALPEIVKSPMDWRFDIGKRVSIHSWDVQRAKDELLRRIARHPGKPPARHGRPYWFLRLNAPEWFYSAFPATWSHAFPSIEQDRLEIRRMATNAGIDITRRRTRIRHCAAGLRASFRDMKWFQEQLAKLRCDLLCKSDQLRGAALQLRVDSLKSALDEILRSEQRPVRIDSRVLGKAAGLSHAQASQAIRDTPALQMAMVAANQDKYRRQVLWAARQVHAANQMPSLKAILRRASLPTLSRYFDLARLALAQIQSEKSA